MGLFDIFRKKDESGVAVSRDAASVWGPILEHRQDWAPEMFRLLATDESQIVRGDGIAQMIVGDIVFHDISRLACKKSIHRGLRLDDQRRDWLLSLIGVALIDTCVAKCNATFGSPWIDRVEPFLTSYAWQRLPYFLSLYADRQKFGQEQAEALSFSTRDKFAGMKLMDVLFNSILIMNCAWLSLKLYPGCEASVSHELAEDFVGQAKISSETFCSNVQKYVMRNNRAMGIKI